MTAASISRLVVVAGAAASAARLVVVAGAAASAARLVVVAGAAASAARRRNVVRARRLPDSGTDEPVPAPALRSITARTDLSRFLFRTTKGLPLHPFSFRRAAARTLGRRRPAAAAIAGAAIALGLAPGAASAGYGLLALSDPVAYSTTWDGYNRVVYRGMDNAIHELYYNHRTDGPWGEANLSQRAGAPAPGTVARPRAYTTPDHFARVLYRGTDAHVHELYYKQGSAAQNESRNDWGHADLSKLADAPASARILGDPFGYYFDGYARAVYRGFDLHIHELAYKPGTAAINPSGTDWRHTDLTANGAALAAGDPAGFVMGTTARVLYRGFDGHIHQLSSTEAPASQPTWSRTDLSVAASAPTAASDPTGYGWGGYARVVYRGVDNAVHELASPGATWSHGNLTAIAQAPKARADATPRAYTTNDDDHARVVYSGEDGSVHELSYGGPSPSWSHLRLSGTLAIGDPFGYDTPKDITTAGDRYTRVVYRTIDLHVRELYSEKAHPGWAEGDLPVGWPVPSPVGEAQCAGTVSLTLSLKSSTTSQIHFTGDPPLGLVPFGALVTDVTNATMKFDGNPIGPVGPYGVTHSGQGPISIGKGATTAAFNGKPVAGVWTATYEGGSVLLQNGSVNADGLGRAHTVRLDVGWRNPDCVG
jgi:hypothetical protein